MRFQIVRVSQNVRVVLLRQQVHVDEGNSGFLLACFLVHSLFRRCCLTSILGNALMEPSCAMAGSLLVYGPTILHGDSGGANFEDAGPCQFCDRLRHYQ